MANSRDQAKATVNTRRFGTDIITTLVFPEPLLVADESTIAHFTHTLCNVIAIDDIVMVPESEEEAFGLGKRMQRVISRIKKLDPLTVTLNGNAMKTMAAFQQTDIQETHTIELTGDVEKQCHLINYGHDKETGELFVTDCVLNLTARLLAIPGGAEGETQSTIELYSDDPVLLRADGEAGYTMNVEMWFHDSTIINAVAPDGIIVAFTLGGSNPQNATALVATPMATPRPNPDTNNTFFHIISVDGVEVADSELASTAAGVITFNTPPPAASALFTIYTTLETTEVHGDTRYRSWEDVLA